MNNFLKNISIYSIARILPAILSFVLLPIYINNTTTYDYGIISSMQILSVIVGLTFTLGIDLALFRIYHDYDNEKDKRDLLGTIFIFLLVMSGFFILIYFLFQNTVNLLFISIEFYPYYIITIGYTFLNLFAVIPLIYFQVKHKSKSYLFFSLLSIIVNACFILYFLVFKQQGAIGYLKGEFISKLILLPIFIYLTFKIINFNFYYKKLINVLKFSLPMIPGLLSTFILNLSDRIFIERYFSLEDVAIYTLSYKLASIILLVCGAFSMAYNPFFYEKASSSDQVTAKKELSFINNIYAIISLYLSVGLILFANNILDIFFDERYWSGNQIIPFIVVGSYFSLITGLLNLMYNQQKKSLELMYIIIIGAILNIVLNIVFIPIYGITGAAFSTLASFIIIFLIQYKYAKLYYFIEFDFLLIIKAAVPMFFLLFLLLFDFESGLSAYYKVPKTSITILILVAKIILFLALGLITMYRILPAYFINNKSK